MEAPACTYIVAEASIWMLSFVVDCASPFLCVAGGSAEDAGLR